MLRNKRTGRLARNVGVIVCVLLGMALGVYHNQMARRKKPDVVIATVRTVTAPVMHVAVTTSRFCNRQIGWLFHGRTLARENQRLKDRNAQLTDEVSRLREAAATAERLQAQLGFASQPPLDKVAAQVIALRPNSSLDTITISRGTRDGVKKNSIVVSPYGLVGSVIDAAPTTSTVLLLSDSNASVGAMVQRPNSRAIGVCKGNGEGQQLSLEFLNREADVKVGDTVVSSGLAGTQGVFSIKGLVVGTVTSVTKDQLGANRSVLVKPAVDYNRLEEVYVLR